MNIEGTKHEKAVLVVIAYIIGFTSGFIAFGISGGFKDDHQKIESYMPTVNIPPPGEYVPPTDNPPPVPMFENISPDEQTNEVPANDMMPEGEVVSYVDGKLYAMVGDERFVLSISNSVMSRDNVEGFSTQGIHENLPTYDASADGAFIHFCEQQSTNPECAHFVFDVQNNVIQFVSVNGEKLVTANNVATSASWSAAGLQVGGYVSASPETPWILTSAQ